MDTSKRVRMDIERYERASQSGRCFICAMLAGEPRFRHHLLYEDTETIAFLSRYPTLPGYSLVAPRRHAESWVRDLSAAQFLAFQAVVRNVAVALETVLPTERMYSLSLGSQQGNSHLHWHLAPLPPGVPYARQQYHALMAEHGVLEVSEEQQAQLAARIRRALAA
ncbi:MAG TPA: HIT family protein [Streptosporangiaceae bacterium]